MKKDILNIYVLDLLKSCEHHLADYTQRQKPKHLHGLRVDIKKLKAIFSFAENIYKEQYDATVLKQVFYKAGKIRELHINMNLLEAVAHPPKRLIAKLKKKESILVKQFIENSSRYQKLIGAFRKNVRLPETLPGEKTIKRYFKKQQSKAAELRELKDRKVMHRYRKRIKKIMYLYNALPKRIQHKIELNKAEIDKLQTELGNWHDTHAALHFFSHEHLPMPVSEHIIRLREKERRQFHTLRVRF